MNTVRWIITVQMLCNGGPYQKKVSKAHILSRMKTLLGEPLKDANSLCAPTLHAAARRSYLKEDGAPQYYSTRATAFLKNKLPNQKTIRGGPPALSTCSPSLSPGDFIPWGLMKWTIYYLPIGSMEELKTE